ncbi:AAA family ATPase [Solirubrobacter ginsenosidimutans]|uniref:AAA family ATPase n=1 Tax=Solirubrobacter ginsenosidimutans TaxID=490573 RepID=A0A9X3RY44_9ACTN|nr:BTAD domain-containing putative transcriptional regulator [Solirubrobacter ginsenosidimutans]MDA0159270.1 AAA family ATPase [Solirubrobacter ginsenosidimutans]
MVAARFHPANTAAIAFEILGPLTVRSGASVLELGGPRPRAVLAMLLLHPNTPVSAERLAVELLGGDSPGQAVRTIRVHVSRVRKALGDPTALTTTPAGYQLRVRPGELDADRFEQLVAEARAARPRRAAELLREALALWRGPALAGLDHLPFAALEVARLHEARLAALEARLQADLALGAHADLVGELLQLTRTHVQRERLHELLMLALYRSGRQAEALEAYRTARSAFVAELGLEPGPRLRELERAILQQDPRLELMPELPVGAPERPFVGRTAELAVLLAALDGAVAGRGRVCLVAGEPGIGKSRLTEELSGHAAARGISVLVGRCWEAGGAPAFWPWVQALRAYVAGADTDTLRAQLGAAAPDLAQLLPELRQRFPGMPEPNGLGSDGARFRLFEAVSELLRSVSVEQPLVLVIDDLHAADSASLLLLRFLARSLGTSRVLIVCAYRDVDPVPGSSLVETLADVSREPLTVRMALGPLSEADVAEYVTLTAAAFSGLAADLHAETDGNPLFLGETVRLLAAEGAPIAVPQTVRDVVQRRIAHLSPACGAILAHASVLGREFAVAPLVQLSELPEDAVLDALDEAMAARVIGEVPDGDGRLRFSHMVIRDTLYGELTGPRRTRLHRQALGALEADGDLSELAHHAAAAHDRARTLDYAHRAGDRALTLHAYEEAGRLYRTALAAAGAAEEQRCELLLAIGRSEIRAGDLQAGKRAFLAAAEIARRLGLARALAEAAHGYGGRNVFARAGEDRRILTLLEEGLEALGNADPELRILLLARLAGALRDEHSSERRERLSREAVALARQAGSPEALAYALTARTAATHGPDTVEACIASGREMERIATSTGDLEQIAAAYTHQVWGQIVTGQIENAERLIIDAQRAAAKLRQPARTWIASSQRDGLELLRGRLDGFESALEATRSLGERATPEMAIPAYHIQRHALCELRGTLADAEPGIAGLAAKMPWRPSFRCVLAQIHVRTGRPAEAQRALTQLLRDDCTALPLDEAWLYAMSLLAEVSARLGDAPAAAVLYRRLLPYAHLQATDFFDGFRGAMPRYLALLATTLGRLDDADAHFQAAIAINERTGARPWLAFAQHDYARLLETQAEPARARHWLDAALSAYRELGMASPWPPRLV